MKKLLHFLALSGLLVPAALAQLSVGSTGTLHVGLGATLSVKGALSNAGILTNQGQIHLAGNLVNAGTLSSPVGDWTLNGTTAQTLTSSSALSVKDLSVDNAAAGEAITLATPLTVGGTATFTDGILKTSASQPLILADGATVSGVSDVSHAKGPVKKTGDDAFVFPIGNGTAYRPAAISPVAGLASDAFTAEYQEANPGNAANREACLAAVSTSEYWQIERTAGSSSAGLGLAYQNVATPVADAALLRVARYSGSAWEALTCAANGGLANGRVATNGAIATFGRFTLAAYLPNSLSVTYPALTSLCAGTTLLLTVATGGGFGANNVFTAQLSAPDGTWPNTPVSLGPVTEGSNLVTIPPGTASGAMYKLRVVASDPVTLSNESSGFEVTPLTFSSTPTVNQTPACAGGSIKVSFTLGATCPVPAGIAFIVQLSDKTGSFAAAVTLPDPVVPGINTVGIPPNTPTGTSYRVRIAASADPSALLSAPSSPFPINQPAFAATPTVSLDNKCAGEAVRLSFAITGCAFPAGNGFTAQLSDKVGSFAAPLNVGSVSPGALNTVTVPVGTPAGTGYKLRVVSSNPALTSAASGNFKVKACGQNREVAPEEGGLRVAVSPNPAPEGYLKIVVSGAGGQGLRVSLLNGMGQFLREATIGRASEQEVLDWDITRQPAGLYLLRVSDGRESKTLKVLH